MQGLSSRAHAFSVEALVGKPCKKMKVSGGHESSLETGSNTSVFTGLREYPVSQMKKAASTPKRKRDTSCDVQRQTIKSDDLDPSGEDNKSRTTDNRPDAEVRVDLQGSELWKRFYEIGTEMIITKAGRRMFPSVRVKVRNLDPCQQYYIAMDVMPVDSKRYRYVYHSSQWMVAGNTDHSCSSPRLYVHPDSPCAGEAWMRQVISFDRVKLTNNETDDKGHIILQSMHKYKPRVHIIQHDPRVDLSQFQSLPTEGVHSFSFPETEFTTVTAYQNQQITKLKIDRNPFAKGFRDPGRNRGALDGLLESYPWGGPLSLDLKPFTMIQGASGSQSSSLKRFLPLFSSPLHSFAITTLSCQDDTLDTVAIPVYSKASTTTSFGSVLPHRVLSSPAADRLRGLPSLSPLTDLPFLSVLQAKKPHQCKDPHLHSAGASSPCVFPVHSPISPHGPSHLPHHSDTVGPYCLYRYSIPLSPQLPVISWNTKLEDTTDCLLHQSSWHPTTNHCL